jgi:glutamine amidotransferase
MGNTGYTIQTHPRMISIIDYGVGNIGSVLNMLRKIRVRACISSNATEIEAADKIILPGVGHFGQGMLKLQKSGLIPILERQIHNGKPTLGICLGMQMMTRGSEESDIPGLNWVNARTKRIIERPGLRVPHMGWNQVHSTSGFRLFDVNASEPERFYFVHSYCVEANDPSIVAARCFYGEDFVAGFESGNLMGVQFHPEKSHLFGMALLRRFAAL